MQLDEIEYFTLGEGSVVDAEPGQKCGEDGCSNLAASVIHLPEVFLGKVTYPLPMCDTCYLVFVNKFNEAAERMRQAAARGPIRH